MCEFVSRSDTLFFFLEASRKHFGGKISKVYQLSTLSMSREKEFVFVAIPNAAIQNINLPSHLNICNNMEGLASCMCIGCTVSELI